MSAGSFGDNEESAFKRSVASEISEVDENDVTNVVASDVTTRRGRRSKRKLTSDASSAIEVSYTLEISVDAGSETGDVFDMIVNELTAAVTSGALETAIQSQTIFAGVSVDESSYEEPKTFTVVYAPASNLAAENGGGGGNMVSVAAGASLGGALLVGLGVFAWRRYKVVANRSFASDEQHKRRVSPQMVELPEVHVEMSEETN